MQGSLQSAAERPSGRNSWIWTREGQFRPLGRVAFVEGRTGGAGRETAANRKRAGRKGHPHVFHGEKQIQTHPIIVQPIDDAGKPLPWLRISRGPGSPCTLACGMENLMCKCKYSYSHFLLSPQTTLASAPLAEDNHRTFPPLWARQALAPLRASPSPGLLGELSHAPH